MPKSPEGIPLNQYSWFKVFLALPIAVLLEIYQLLVRRTIRSETIGSRVPPNAIIPLFHSEFMFYGVTLGFWRNRSLRYLGAHSFLSYAASLRPLLDRIQCFRYDRRRAEKPIDQVLGYLAANSQSPFCVRTDSGGPYGHVRKSVVVMASRTSRPVVPVRQFANRFIQINHHLIPLPFSRVTTVVGNPIPAKELQELGPENGRAYIQKQMDCLSTLRRQWVAAHALPV